MTELLLTEAVPLAHALVSRVAEDLGVRCLFIKGPAAVVQGLRTPRTSVDVDALIDPSGLEKLRARLTELGWVDEHPYSTPTAGTYSRTHRHRSWPCELDLHVTFPGLYADPQTVFDLLWKRRAAVSLAGQQVNCPDQRAHALVLALNLLRDPYETSNTAALGTLVEFASGIFDADDLADLGRLAGAIGAPDTAAPFLEALGAPNEGLGQTAPEDLRAWRMRTQRSWRVATWIDDARHQRLRSLPVYLWRAVVLSESEVRMADPTLSPGRAALARARVRRLRRGVAALPSAIRSVWSGTDRPFPGIVPGSPSAVSGTGVPEVVIATLLRPEVETGVQTYLQALAAQLRTQGRPVSVVSPFAAGSLLVLPAKALRLPLHWQSRVLAVSWLQRRQTHFLRALLRRRLQRLPKGGVVYAQCPASADAALSVRHGEPVVMVAHFDGLHSDEWSDRGEVDLDDRFSSQVRDFEADVLSRLDGIVFVSEWSRSLLEERVPALRSVPSVTVPNFVEARRASVTETPSPVADLVSVGTLEPRKNQGYLLEVLAAARARGHRYTLDLVGDGVCRRAWEKRARELGLADHVRFLGFRHHARGLLAGHRAYVHPARMENLPFALIEAMAEGLPVVAGAVGAIPSMFHQGVEGLFWPLDDAAAAADVLAELLTPPGRAERMGEAARDLVVREYAASVVVPRLEAFLDIVPARPH